MKGFSTPFFLAIPYEDDIVGTEKAFNFFKEVGTTDKDKQLKQYDAEHSIHMANEVVFDLVKDQVAWLNRRYTPYTKL